ncbi:hypothetical protein PAPYR_9364 [Paratrimastix pyriformis]|uniref:Uncharacterized protein n=1 Tax=Paratrimastix pyriformis TaxID=342808 RepID=A0ABQ8UC57_9EUKA|nr:hypothetical protein PAPYR_9364 [Paratrimastix pyriformis]
MAAVLQYVIHTCIAVMAALEKPPPTEAQPADVEAADRVRRRAKGRQAMEGVALGLLMEMAGAPTAPFVTVYSRLLRLVPLSHLRTLVPPSSSDEPKTPSSATPPATSTDGASPNHHQQQQARDGAVAKGGAGDGADEEVEEFVRRTEVVRSLRWLAGRVTQVRIVL